jgi:hypothetical protein
MARALHLASLFACVLALTPAPSGAQTCATDAQCADGDLCDGIERCVAGSCAPGRPLVCDDANPCTEDYCDPTAGCGHRDTACPTSCGPADDGARCSDGSACTTGDTCGGGVCGGTPLACDDGDPCTADSCDVELGCVYVERADPPACVDANACASLADHTPCVADANPCTQDGCLLGDCQVGLLQLTRQCADGDACNGEEFCSPIKECQSGPPPVCDDGESCNGTEGCNAASGCVPGVPAADGTPCDDGKQCTGDDRCSAGACGGTTRDCDDGDGATTDVCTEATGCLHCTPITAATIAITFPAPPRLGSFATKGSIAMPGGFDPTTAAGADFLLHDGPTVIQRSHVAGGAFVANAAGNVEKFTDRSGTQAMGLRSLRLKRTLPATIRAKGYPTGSERGSDAATSMTIVAGPACATTTLPCTLARGGTSRRCR